eukprot:9502490-Pyramimonas_sp.AAC.2
MVLTDVVAGWGMAVSILRGVRRRVRQPRRKAWHVRSFTSRAAGLHCRMNASVPSLNSLREYYGW